MYITAGIHMYLLQLQTPKELAATFLPPPQHTGCMRTGYAIVTLIVCLLA